MNAEFVASLPASLDEFSARTQDLLEEVGRLRPMLSVLALELIQNPTGSVQPPPDSTVVIRGLINAHRADRGIRSDVDADVAALCVAALTWAVALFGRHWATALGLAEVPTAQIAEVLRGILAR